MTAWVTLLTQPSYLPGVRALRRSLALAGSVYPLVVMVTADVDAEHRAELETDGCLVRQVAPVRPPASLRAQYANARFEQVWTKLAAWTLTEFERVVFLDADMLVTQNMDELLTLPLPDDAIAACHACRCNPERIASYPASWTPQNCAYSDHSGTADGQYREGQRRDDYLNGGLLVLRPDQEVFSAMLRQLAAVDDLSRYLFAEQDFLNDFYRDRWHVLPYVYNALKTLPFQHPGLWDAAAVKNLHYIIDKPWQKVPDPQDRYYWIDTLWWDIAGHELTPSPSRASVPVLG